MESDGRKEGVEKGDLGKKKLGVISSRLKKSRKDGSNSGKNQG